MVIGMLQKEIREARRAGIPENIIGKMAVGIVPNEKEKEIIKRYGKVYVEMHKKDGKRIRPQLRDLPGYKLPISIMRERRLNLGLLPSYYGEETEENGEPVFKIDGKRFYLYSAHDIVPRAMRERQQLQYEDKFAIVREAKDGTYEIWIAEED